MSQWLIIKFIGLCLWETMMEVHQIVVQVVDHPTNRQTNMTDVEPVKCMAYTHSWTQYSSLSSICKSTQHCLTKRESMLFLLPLNMNLHSTQPPFVLLPHLWYQPTFPSIVFWRLNMCVVFPDRACRPLPWHLGEIWRVQRKYLRVDTETHAFPPFSLSFPPLRLSAICSQPFCYPFL